MAVATVVALLLASAASTPAAGARDPRPDLLAGALRPGAAEVALGFSGFPMFWNPRTHAKLSFLLTARLRGHHRVGSKQPMWVRFQPPRVR
jgi:hypothetical protein